MTQAPAPLGTRAALPDGTRATFPDGRPGAGMRAHLFLELRGFAELIQTGAAADAASVLLRFNRLVADRAARYDGAELRAEGDGAYVTFLSAADAIGCGLQIVGAEGVSVGGTGVAAGIATDTDAQPAGGYLTASAVCAAAAPGQVLATDGARRLAATSQEIRFSRAVSRWSRSGTARQGLWIAAPATAPTVQRTRPLRRGLLVSVVVVALLVIGAAVVLPRSQPAAIAFAGPITIGAQLPLGGERDNAAFGQALQDAIALAIDDANTGSGEHGPTIKLRALDGGEAGEDALARSSMNSLVGDSSVIGVVGPAWSATAFQDVPIGNSAGLLQCSPANTNPRLTKPEYGALDFRSAAPNRISYVRLIATDDMQGPGAAAFVFSPGAPGSPNLGIPATQGLGVEHALVIDDTTNYGRREADAFQADFEAKGGVVDRRAHNPGADDLAASLVPLGDTDDPAGAVYFGGDAQAALEVKTAMAAAGFAQVPFVSSDALFDGTGSDKGSFIQQAGPLAANTYITHAGIAPVDADFQTRYRRTFGAVPSDYAAASYACTQVIIAAMRDAIAHGADAAGLREAVRAAVVGATSRTPTVIGSVGFDANGDSLDQYVTFYHDDPTGADGKGDWAVLDQQNFGPAP